MDEQKPYPQNILDNLDNPTWQQMTFGIQTIKDCIRAEVNRERERCHGIVVSESEHINGAGLCEVFNRMLRRIRQGGK